MNNEFKIFCSTIYIQSYELFKVCGKLNNYYNPNLETMILEYIKFIKGHPSAKAQLIKSLQENAVSVNTLKQSLKYMVTNHANKSPYKLRVIEEVNNFIKNPQNVILELERIVKEGRV